MTSREIAEIACSEAIAEVLNKVSGETRISAFSLAIRVPGACHDHPPTKHVVPGCAFCARNGNAFCADPAPSSAGAAASDIVAAHVARVALALEELQRDVRACLAGGDVRACLAGGAAEFDDLDDALFKAMTEDMV